MFRIRHCSPSLHQSMVLPARGDDSEEKASRRREKKQQQLTLIPLIFLIYFEVSSRPYGEEPAVQAAGPFLAILDFLISPFVWSIPEALITAELATAFPGNGGYVVWATEAFGPFTGSLMGSWKYLSGVINNAAYPVLCADCLSRIFSCFSGGTPRDVVIVGFTLALSFLNYTGVDGGGVGGGGSGGGVAGAVRGDGGSRSAEGEAREVAGEGRDGGRSGEDRLEPLPQHPIQEPQLLGQHEHAGGGGGVAAADVPAGAAGGGASHLHRVRRRADAGGVLTRTWKAGVAWAAERDCG
ncbi:hypothetical protein Taro_041800 [Colocasia esculenta]|uniref:Uncharacterized protein n=1 Tax=Colocasia esculenta TaxID=4460 RepID=A0A843WY94_COLES|nr:hypothetical protein [Colocasia esculenta]